MIKVICRVWNSYILKEYLKMKKVNVYFKILNVVIYIYCSKGWLMVEEIWGEVLYRDWKNNYNIWWLKERDWKKLRK